MWVLQFPGTKAILLYGMVEIFVFQAHFLLPLISLLFLSLIHPKSIYCFVEVSSFSQVKLFNVVVLLKTSD